MAYDNVREIPPIPQIPPELRNASVIAGKIIPFIGAGVSRLAGGPSWNELADMSLKFFVESGELTYCEFEQLKPLSARVKLSLAMQLDAADPQLNFEKMLHPEAISKDREIGTQVYGYIEAIASTFITTNYDYGLRYKKSELPHIETNNIKIAAQFERTLVYKRDEFRADLLNKPDTVIHLHGSIAETNSMILTTQHYLEHYARDRIGDENPVLTFLSDLFKIKTVIFIGYGLDELEVLEYVIQKGANKRRTKSDKPKHYLIQGFFSNQLELANHLKLYYQSLGIELLPFSRDKSNWTQLLYVLKHLAQEIPANKMLNAEKRSEMRKLLDDE